MRPFQVGRLKGGPYVAAAVFLAVFTAHALDRRSLGEGGQTNQRQPDFRVGVYAVQTDLIARDGRGQFVADLKPNEFEIVEDGVRQKLEWLTLVHGGRVFERMAIPPLVREGFILPVKQPTNDISGRIFVIVLDDLHLEFGSTIRVQELVRKMMRLLIHEGDMFGIVSTGTSSISEPLTYDRQVLESAISRMKGEALSPEAVITGSSGPQGPTELRHRAHVAFSTVYELLRNLEKVPQRRKAILYISSGYDFNPFETSRLEEQARRAGVDASDLQTDPFTRAQQSSQMLSESDLVREIAEITAAANRASATLYTIDPRGLVAGPDIDQPIRFQEWNAFVRDSQDSLRVIAAATGGLAVVNQNDFDTALKRIDVDTSAYYAVGYYSTNPNPSKRVRRIEIKTTRSGVNILTRPSYTLAAPR